MNTLLSILPGIGTVLLIGFALFCLFMLKRSIQIVPQSMKYNVERLGKFTRTLEPGMSIVIPILDKVAHKVSILERQLEAFSISVITRDNVEIDLVSTVFFRIVNPEKTMYRIANIQEAIYTTATSIVRSAAGKLELDEVQSSREKMNAEIASSLQKAAEDWGVEVTRTEVLDVKVDEKTKDSQRMQLNAERERRAVVAKAEGSREAIQLKADGELYQAQKEADAVRIKADATAYAVEKKATADAEQTRLLAVAISNNGEPAIEFELRKRQIQAIGDLSYAKGTQTLVLPTEVASVLGSLDSLVKLAVKAKKFPEVNST